MFESSSVNELPSGPHAVGVELRRGVAAEQFVAQAASAHARLQRQKVHDVAVWNGQFLQLGAGDLRRDAALLGLERLGLRAHVHGFGDAADLHAEIHFADFVRRHFHGELFRGQEAVLC